MINNLTSEGPNNPVKKKNNETIVVKDKRSGGKIPGLAFPGKSIQDHQQLSPKPNRAGKRKMSTYKIRRIDVDFPFEADDCQLVYMEKNHTVSSKRKYSNTETLPFHCYLEPFSHHHF